MVVEEGEAGGGAWGDKSVGPPTKERIFSKRRRSVEKRWGLLQMNRRER